MAVLQKIKVPLVSVNDTSLTVADILFAQKDFVKKDDVLMVFETSKTTYDVPAETDGYISYECEAGGEYEVNEIVATIYSEKEEVPDSIIKENSTLSVLKKGVRIEEAVGLWKGETLFSAAAAALMKANGISADIFQGMDFVSRIDVEQKLNSGKPVNNKVSLKRPEHSLLPTDDEKVIVEKLSSNKKREIEYLGSVQSFGLISTVNTAVETDGIFLHINQSLQYLKNSLLPVVIYETARLLGKYKLLNAYFTGDAIAYYKEVNVGFAVDIGKGLKVLKVAAASEKNIAKIENDIMALSGKYIDDRLQIDDLTDISFTITDLSAESVSSFVPLINMMNSAILGISSIDEKLNRCMLSITFDHRVTEGKLVAQFLHELKDRLESYRSKHHPHTNQDISCFKCFKMLKDDLGDIGFAKCITPKGEEAYVCQSCLKGF